ncbi:MAG: hypothetical protein Q8P46_07955 [Hyphomicrobiales bacterium]|nr:hypothetical protein [Hyphomicrobiales bacterium]
MDKLYGALDVRTRDLLQNELLHIWERYRKTVIYVTHRIEEALYPADGIVVMTPRLRRIRALLKAGAHV